MGKVMLYGLIYKNGNPHATFSAPYVVRPDGTEEFDLPTIADDFGNEGGSGGGDLYYIEVLDVVGHEDDIPDQFFF